jgi:hypothetical protein
VTATPGRARIYVSRSPGGRKLNSPSLDPPHHVGAFSTGHGKVIKLQMQVK